MKSGVRVREVMGRRFASLGIGEELDPGSLLARFRQLGHLVVLDTSGRLVGMVTRADVLEHLVEGGRRRVKVQKLMSAPVLRVDPDQDLHSAARAMLRHRVGTLPVVDRQGAVVGMLRESDVLGAFETTVRQPAEGLGELSIFELMTPDPATVGLDASVGDAAGLMLEGGMRHLPVVDRDERLVGMVSERDLRERLGTEPRDWPSAGAALSDRVSNVMTPDPISLPSSASISEAISVLLSEKVGAIPVVDEDDRVQGILSYLDVLRWMEERSTAAQEEGATPAP